MGPDGSRLRILWAQAVRVLIALLVRRIEGGW